MRILVVGAGAVGGFFGAQLARAGRDVTFLVRPKRAEVLRAEGLSIRPFRDEPFSLTPKTVTADQLDDAYDVVLLSVKAYGLEQVLSDIAPAIGPTTVILPVLNGLRHFDVLRERFGAERIVGGLCFIAAQLSEGVIEQIGPGAAVIFGEFGAAPGEPVSDRMLALHSAFSDAGFSASVAPSIEQALWQKWVLLAAGGALTTLLRGPVGFIVAAPGGADVARGIAEESFSIAAAAGFALDQVARDRALATLTEPGSPFTTSLYRDLAQGLDVESEQIVGDFVNRAGALGVSVPLLALAYTGLSVYRQSIGAA
ncbi:2-dehydropantoate 2-reductase [Subtercola sp. RTI3]|uniref:2-dehydropantoate 2-reductase n=1 Tax=Subtercola sp. RTI3 TaxID=3048639 RepID=UPI002B23B7B0|nr:2-dehydropantoate 2-reductase [Subtercola sp. RTI3]MEA9983998.1 2-dehydropantoate 2-reductase [Subtercola sp. RTI3]